MVGHRLSILVVDDEPLLLMNMAALVEDLGHVAIEAGSAPAALAVARSGRPFEMLITDEAMPGGRGVELASSIQQMRPQVRVIIATGYDRLPAGARAEWGLLQKPFGLEELAKIIAQVV